jgi:hypothetical protein
MEKIKFLLELFHLNHILIHIPHKQLELETGKLYRLEKFIETPNSLIFEYESNTSMTLLKREKDIIINIKEQDTNTNIIKPMDSIVREIFKPIKWSNLATEYDKIPEFIRPKFEDIKTDLGRELALGSVISQQPIER